MPTNEQRRQAAKRKLDRQIERRAERAKRRRLFGVVGTVAAVLLVVVLIVVIANAGGDDTANADPNTQPPPTSAPPPKPVEIPTQLAPAPKRPTPLPATVDCTYEADPKDKPPKPVNPPDGKKVGATGTATLTFKTAQGDLPLTLDKSLAPCTAQSMINLAKQGFFDGTSCHRLSTEGLQMLQCGDPTGTGSGGPGYQFADEVFPELKYGRGILAMANSGPNTNGSQFFIVYGNAGLPAKYTAFGTIGEPGLKIVDDVARADHDHSLDSGPGGGKPNKKLTFDSATVS
ncbi:peptidyl-prolyl cis-trans isomerase B (cyclophilin B) [Herbihabitans rhizosphaerae]|uniref:Peptidyl-prolyl cis-trans isomerase n=1 Tax=Herbihabitans rhizosphaerae TaxID=1872711 RepID=A0A4Q7KK99_9PSEU|nr:peptidylprolyl isomerase [Herbihabitans rhizosphaerae]RZS34336.1 peptidyl-prolyl cis-trans isomerase B (cyclophilin B) [Herbihabitans rhizosphaerae]